MKRGKALTIDHYGAFLEEIKSRIISARIQASRTINKELIGLYWDIGRSITERQAMHKWGDSVVNRLSADLCAEFKNVSGFSVQNLWRMRLFYLAYRDNKKLAQAVREIPFSC